MTAEAQRVAEACAEAMWAGDRASQGLGMVIERVAPGEAVLSMVVRPDMVNGHGIVHGGLVFTLADSAFAFACNSHDQKAVSASATVAFLAPAKEGERLTATARERHRAGRSGLCDVTVTGGNGAVIAEFRGASRTIKGTHLSEDG